MNPLRIPALLLLALLLAGALPGRGEAAQPGPATCANPTNPEEPIQVQAGAEFSIALASNPTTGYSWHLGEALNEQVVTLVSNTYVPPAAQIPGAGGVECWVFRAAGPGTATIVLNYLRPFEMGVPPVRTATFRVQVSASQQPGAATWTPTASMSTPRIGHTATALQDGRVLVAGGATAGGSGSVTATAELYDPTTGMWSVTGSMATARQDHTATLLGDGRVLVAGGTGSASGGGQLASAELYDPTSSTWSSAGVMTNARADHAAALLADGTVLVAGGSGAAGMPGAPAFLASAELFHPTTGAWSVTGSMSAGRFMPTATALQDGTVLVAGGNGGGLNVLASAELYAPTTGTWGATASMSTGRVGHTATRLQNGTVLVAGGGGNGTPPPTLNTSEVYNPVAGTWSAPVTMPAAQTFAVAVLLPNGSVLVAGGVQGSMARINNAQLYANGAWSATTPMLTASSQMGAALLPGGRVLVAGGLGNTSILASAQIFAAGQ